MSLQNQDMYAIYTAGIAKAFGLPDNASNLILVGDAFPADLACYSKGLGSDAPSVGAALGQIFNLCNTELYPNGFFDQTAYSFFNEYATYIDNLEPANSQKGPSETQQAQINLIRGSLASANTQFTQDQSAAVAAYTTASGLYPGQYPTFASFLAQTPWGGTLTTDNNTIIGCNSQLNTIYSEVYGDDYTAIMNNKNAVDAVRSAMSSGVVALPTEMLISNGTTTALVVPSYTPGDLQAFSNWVDQTIGQHGNPGSQQISIAFKEGSSEYDFSESTYFKQTSWSTDYFFFSTGGTSTTSSTQVNINTASESFALTLGFDAVRTMPVQPGPWFDSSLLTTFPNAGGLVRPTSLLIGMYPTVTLTMDADSYNSAYSAYTSSSSFGVGVFFIGGGDGTSSSNTNMQATWDADSNSVTMVSQSTTPVVVGMTVAPLGG